MKRFKWYTMGNATKENIVMGDKYRFTVLTPRMIRIEYDENGKFEDRASQVVFYRDFQKCDFTVEKNNSKVIIKTEYLSISYIENAILSPETLQITLESFNGKVWRYGDRPQNLKGTVSTLDCVNGSTELEDGICSREGYSVIDDSNTMLLTEDGWFDIRRSGGIDMYFLGYGHDYLECIADFYRLTGAPPMLPDYALGNWWSRFHKYTQEEYCNLMKRFESENIPFSVAVVDMDWHKAGWTGYSWNKELFPDYKAFLKFLKQNNLKTALNLHPANGVGAHEDMYAEMAIACGMDPESKKTVKFDCLSPDFMEKYFDILHHPYEEDGVDFWWMDWQQGRDYSWVHDEEHKPSELEQMHPLWLLNHLHIQDIKRSGKRPMFFSRYAGLGSHRYPVGFSGDTIVTWESLDFQPYFTANASNVGYTWWSHDIGGHMAGYRDDELQIRWLQLGVFSPINRLHSSNSPFAGKEPWNLGYEAEKIAGDYLRLRHQLFPYIYTMNYRNSIQLKPLVQPMYYSHPECDEAYTVPNQYWFGSELFVSPITSKADSVSGLGQTEVWLPEGKWIDFFNGFVYEGDRKITVSRGLGQVPIFAKAGAIVPTEKYDGSNKLGNKENMTVCVFAGDNNKFTMYEDCGDGFEYEKGGFATTEYVLNWKKGFAEFIISSAAGDLSIIPKKRNWEIKFIGFKATEEFKVMSGEEEIAYEKSYNPQNNTISVSFSGYTNTEYKISVFKENLTADNSNAKDRIFDILLHSQMSYDRKKLIWEFINSGKKTLYTVCPEKEHKGVLEALSEMLYLNEVI